jgi:sugar phosphate isomerase/epimerase
MKFSVFTASTPQWSPEVASRTLAAQGWDGIEWRVTDQEDSAIPGFWAGNRATWPLATLARDTPEIARITRDAGLELSGLGGYAPCDDHDGVETLLVATAALGARQVRITVPRTGTKGNYREAFALARHHFEWVAERAAAHGVKALVELHHGTLTSSASSALRLIDGLDPEHIGVIHDLGNLLIEGKEDHLSAFELLGSYLAHVHVKNVRWSPRSIAEPDGSVLWDWQWAPLRTGQADVRGYFDALREFGYDGWVTSEDFSIDLPLEERTRDNLAYLKAVSTPV